MSIPTTTLWRPVGPKELALIEATGMTTFPPRLPEQPIFYPVTTRAYAIKTAGGREHQEYWIPAEELHAFNAAIVGQIAVVDTFTA